MSSLTLKTKELGRGGNTRPPPGATPAKKPGVYRVKREATNDECDCQRSFITFMQNFNNNYGQNISADRTETLL